MRAFMADFCANRQSGVIRPFLYVPFMFFSFSYTLPLGLADESIISARGEIAMIDMGVLGETQTRQELAHLLHTAVERSGRNRCEISREADLHKDALRRTLLGERSPSVGEALRILASSGMAPHAHLLLFLGAGGDQATRWLQTDIARFFEELVGELPSALERVLGNQVHDVKPRWAKGTAHRVARLLADHIDELERKDALLGEGGAGFGGRHG
jgi:DNA-binding phage protein